MKHTAHEGDIARVDTLLRWIDGEDENGARIPVPALFGMSFASVAESQVKDGYVDAIGTPSPGLVNALASVDESVGKLVQELRNKGLYDSTWIAIAAPFGQSPMDTRRRRVIPLARVQAVVESVRPDAVAHITGGDVAMIWLRDPAQTAAVVKALGDRAVELGVQEIYSGSAAGADAELAGRRTHDRMPDILLQPEYGVLWNSADDKDRACGAMEACSMRDNTHVAGLLISSGKRN